ncbi:hypothetical protein GCM10023165_39960 [Variovorax defluvii]|uniref:Uncharacterized protein n=1 Tax=Variovorax defluvii TaxID=913761 RepID=A0ABP8I537_9BURK
MAFLGDQAGMQQLFQVEGQRIGGGTQTLRHDTGRHTAWTGDDQSAENLQASGLRKGSQRADDILFFHDSIILELLLMSTTTKAPGSGEGPHKAFLPAPLNIRRGLTYINTPTSQAATRVTSAVDNGRSCRARCV